MMLNTEVSWNKALTDNNVKGLIGCLQGLYAEAEGDTRERLASFNCWLQRSAELAKKELLMLCFSRCKGLWMFLDEDAVDLIHKLVLKLKSLLSLIHLIEKKSDPLHAKHGSRASYTWGCWKQDHHAIRQHILLGGLVQWWSSTGLLPNYPEAHELKRISQMWREMDQTHRRTCLELSYAEDKYRWSSLVQGMVAHLDKQHGPIWDSEDCAHQTYPPPSLEALLKLVLLPNIDIISVQAIIMYFVLDVSNFVQREDDLLQSFCRVFSIPSAFSQQICGFWLLDHRLITDSMDVLLSPRACPPTVSWHHCAVLRTLLRTGENGAALKYLYSITPTMENVHDVRLCVDVLINNNYVSEAWTLLRGLQTEDIHLFEHFIHACENRGVCRNMLATLCESMAHLHLMESQNVQTNEAQTLNQETTDQASVRSELGRTPRPLSAWLYHTGDPLTPGDFVRILRQSISEINPPPKRRRVVMLSSSCHVANRASVGISHEFKKDAVVEESDEDLPLQSEEEMYDSLPVFSSPSASPDSMESVGFFTSSCSSPSVVCSEAPSAQRPIYLQQKSSTVPEDEDETLADMISGCPDVTLTLDGAAETLSINSLSRSVEKILTSVVPGEISHSSEERRLLRTLNLHPNCYSNEDNQSMCSIPEITTESHNFLSPNHEKLTYHKTVADAVNIKPRNLTDETEAWLISPTGSRFVELRDFESVETSGTADFLELEPLKRALSLSRVEESQDGFSCESQDAIDQPEILTSCAFTDTTHNPLTPLQQADLLADDGEPYRTCPVQLSALKSSITDTDHSLIRLSQPSRQLHSPTGRSLPSPVHRHRPALRVCHQSRHRSSSESRVSSTKAAMCFHTTSERVGYCRLGSWWKQALETRRASTGLLPTLKQTSVVTRGSSTLSDFLRHQTHGLRNFSDLPSSPRVDKGELKQAVEGELTGRRGSFKVTVNQKDHGSTSHYGKTSKQIKYT